MKQLAISVILALSLCLAANGARVQAVHEVFASGAVFEGVVTFTNDYSHLLAVDGWLSGPNYGNDHFTWILAPMDNFAEGYGSQYGGNFLLNGSESDNYYDNFITFTWDFSGAPGLVFASPGDILSPFGGNNIYYSDPLVSGTLTAIPEPGPLGLLALGFGALPFIRRRKHS